MEKLTDNSVGQKHGTDWTAGNPDKVGSGNNTKKSLSASKTDATGSKTKFQDVTYIRRKLINDDIKLVQKHGGNLTEINDDQAKKFGDLVRTMMKENQDSRASAEKDRLPIAGVTSLGPSEHIDPLNLSFAATLLDQLSE
jgi:hypothetical protein